MDAFSPAIKAAGTLLFVLLGLDRALAQDVQAVQMALPKGTGAISDVRTPVRLDRQHPLVVAQDAYSLASRAENEEGVCKVRVEVGTSGKIEHESIEASSGFERLDNACLKAVKGGRMIPATINGKPVASQAIFPISFFMKDHSSPAMLAPHPRLEAGPDFYPPAALELKQEGECFVHLKVSASGEPSDVEISQSTGYNTLDHACVMAVRHARFIPAHANGRAYESWTNVSIKWELPKP